MGVCMPNFDPLPNYYEINMFLVNISLTAFFLNLWQFFFWIA